MTMDEFGLHFKMLAVRYPADDDFVAVVKCHVADLSETGATAVR